MKSYKNFFFLVGKIKYLNPTLYGLFWSFRHKLYSSNTKDFFVLFLGQGHKGCPCDQVEMKIGHNEGLLREL